MFKRLIDIVGSLFGLIVCAPILLIVALAIWLVEGRPILHRGQRVGRFGEPFLMVKFRSMIPDAELRGSAAIAARDPRVTGLGRLLRITKLDELPQFYNVLKGDMSLVGPRPELWRYANSFEGERRQILDLRPGLTDWATLVDIDEFALLSKAANPDLEYNRTIRPVKVALQLKYIREMSAWTDMRIIFYTAVKLVARRWVPSEFREFRSMLEGSLLNADSQSPSLAASAHGAPPVPEELVQSVVAVVHSSWLGKKLLEKEALKGDPKQPPLQKVAFSVPEVPEEAVDAVVAVLRSGWMTTGPRTAELETAFGAFVGAHHVLAVNSCTAGLHLALAGLGIGPGDEVITTPLTFCATVNVILQVGATPILADIGPDLNIDPQSIARAITPRTRAIMPVHMAGLPCNMDAIWDLARAHNLRVVEDAAHASGASYGGVRIGGGQSDAVAFSFYATKNLATGEGGAVVTPSAELYDRMRILCLHGISRDAWNRYSEQGNWYYEVVACGFKYNMSDIIAAIGIHQLARLDSMNEHRAAVVDAYNRAFAEMPEVEIPPNNAGVEHAWHLYILRLNLDRLTIDRAQFFTEMRKRGINCSVHFIPIPLHPYYRGKLEMRDPCAHALAEYPRLLSLPLYSKMQEEDVSRVIDAVREIVFQFKKQTSGHRRSAPSFP
jgi:dTDP-4-amino-4,6-dideoxygalactose transaminase/lipopolysaccharide/colanic/teichoic acid biosynthesis glycosyltransferase